MELSHPKREDRQITKLIKLQCPGKVFFLRLRKYLLIRYQKKLVQKPKITLSVKKIKISSKILREKIPMTTLVRQAAMVNNQRAMKIHSLTLMSMKTRIAPSNPSSSPDSR
jgi:hypothetical protein